MGPTWGRTLFLHILVVPNRERPTTGRTHIQAIAAVRKALDPASARMERASLFYRGP